MESHQLRQQIDLQNKINGQRENVIRKIKFIDNPHTIEL